MKYILKVSYDCGISYNTFKESNSLEELKKIGCRMDEENSYAQRWVIEDTEGNYVGELCSMHKHLLDTLTRISKDNKNENI